MIVIVAIILGALTSGVICMTAGIKMGRNMEVLRRSMGLPPTPPKEPKADPGICGCGHHQAFHNAEKGCRVEVTTRERWNNKAQDYEDIAVYCTCQKFVSRVPPSTVIRQIEPRQDLLEEARRELDGL